jgi:hypothetical protein
MGARREPPISNTQAPNKLQSYKFHGGGFANIFQRLELGIFWDLELGL